MITEEKPVMILWLFLLVSFLAMGLRSLLGGWDFGIFNAAFYFGFCVFIAWLLLNPELTQLSRQARFS